MQLKRELILKLYMWIIDKKNIVSILILNNLIVKSEIEFLSRLGVSVVYSYVNAISGIIEKVSKVFIKAKSMLSNGNLLGAVGTSLIGCVAYNFKKPVIAFSETYKFWDKILMNSFQSNNISLESGTHQVNMIFNLFLGISISTNEINL